MSWKDLGKRRRNKPSSVVSCKGIHPKPVHSTNTLTRCHSLPFAPALRSLDDHKPVLTLVHFAWMFGLYTFLPTWVFRIKPLKAKIFTGEQKATELAEVCAGGWLHHQPQSSSDAVPHYFSRPRGTQSPRAEVLQTLGSRTHAHTQKPCRVRCFFLPDVPAQLCACFFSPDVPLFMDLKKTQGDNPAISPPPPKKKKTHQKQKNSGQLTTRASHPLSLAGFIC